MEYKHPTLIDYEVKLYSGKYRILRHEDKCASMFGPVSEKELTIFGFLPVGKTPQWIKEAWEDHAGGRYSFSNSILKHMPKQDLSPLDINMATHDILNVYSALRDDNEDSKNPREEIFKISSKYGVPKQEKITDDEIQDITVMMAGERLIRPFKLRQLLKSKGLLQE